ncbi:hypothetical protein BDV59DRAFT_211989 [Aspergillus ambiguus]|uniref:uncharacterized protein n=1 Tax=Aspergillus ambiguus TaxID=176160 RepID=UPI003CCCEBAF
MTRVFLTGASGYVGGDVLHLLRSRHPEYRYSVLLRDSGKAASISKTYPDIRVVLGDLDAASLIEEEVRQSDIIINAASSGHIKCVEAIGRGIATRTDSKPAHWIQISGASVHSIPDIVNGTFGESTGTIHSDIDGANDLRVFVRQNAATRAVDNYLLEFTGCKAAVVYPPIIYGQGRGVVKQRSVQIPELARVTLQGGKGIQVGRGESTWSNVHISDLSEIFVKLVEKAVEGQDGELWNQAGIYFAGNAMLNFKTISQLVAKAANDMKLIDSTEVKEVTPSEADGLTAKGSVFWGTNAKQDSQRARQLLGWAPQGPSLEEEIPTTVQKSRLSMSTAMETELVAGSIDASLAEIDSRSRSPSRSAGDIVVGPFGVLNFESSTVNPTALAPSHPAQQPTVTAAPASVATAPAVLAATPINELPMASPGLSGLDYLAHMDDFLHWSDLLGLNPDQPGMSSSLDAGDFLDFSIPTEVPSPGSRFRGLPSFAMDQYPGPSRTDSNNRGGSEQMLTPQQTPMKDASTSSDILTDAPFLFKHFQDSVIPQMMAMPLGEKSPWKILNLPTAVVTYSDITFLGTRNTSHARLANLYGLMACSAIHLTLKPFGNLDKPVEYWRGIAEQTYQHAKDHMQTSLQCETREPKKAKYKDQLMAICGLIQFAVLSGQQQHARCFMVDAERLLRLRGLPKRRISQKARLLHHVYTWLRIVGESTYVLHDYTPSASFLEALDTQFRTPPSINTLSANENPRLDDFLRLDARNSDSDLNIDEPKDLDVGLHDIHLQDSRVFSETLYKQIYGIPETWLSLVSQTTRSMGDIAAA